MIEHDADDDVVAEEPPPSTSPSVDELENRLRDLQGAMDQIQTGDLDAAEQSIEALEQRMGSRQD